MKYFLDFEFIEGFHKPLFGKRRHFIDLISVGIVCEDGRTYSAIGNQWRYKDADQWVRENVICPLYLDTVHGDERNQMFANTFQFYYGQSNKEIAAEILAFITEATFGGSIEFYGYYSDYDWVLFCSLFGRMIDLPKGFPMMCFDIEQLRIESGLSKEILLNNVPQTGNHNALQDALWNKDAYFFIKHTYNEKGRQKA